MKNKAGTPAADLLVHDIALDLLLSFLPFLFESRLDEVPVHVAGKDKVAVLL